MKIYLDWQQVCPRNLEDQTQLLGNASLFGYTFTNDISEADIVLFFGCASRQDTITNSLRALYYATTGKKSDTQIFVFGCISEFVKIGLAKQGIKAFSSTKALLEHLKKLQNLDDSFKNAYVCDSSSCIADITIGNGCDNACTFCKVHYLDRSLKSEPIEVVLKKMHYLRQAGKTHLALAALNSTKYGHDLYGAHECWLAQLVIAAIKMEYQMLDLKALNINDIDETLEAVLVSSPIPIFLDLPLQHSNNLVLEKMGRKTTAEAMAEKVMRLMKNPNLMIMSGVMVGFPYEPVESIVPTFEYHKDLGIYHVDLFKYIDHAEVPSHKYPQFSQEEIASRFEVASGCVTSMRQEGMSRLVGQTIPIISERGSFLSMPFQAEVEFEGNDKVPSGVVMAKVLRPSGINKLICSRVP